MSSRVLIKAGVQPRSLILVAAVANTVHALGLTHDVTVTSGNDSRHMTGSLHYQDKAIDVRSKNFQSLAAKRAFVEALQRRLGPKYLVILEQQGTANEHFHVEFDPPEATPYE